MSCRAECCHKRVAFYAGLSKNLGPVSENSDLVLDNVVTNLGSAYSPSSGRFTAPVSATYQFNVTISAGGTGAKAAVNLLKKGEKIMNVWCVSTPEWDTSSSVAILSLEAGEQVWLELLGKCTDRPSNAWGDMFTSFSGFLIFEN